MLQNTVLSRSSPVSLFGTFFIGLFSISLKFNVFLNLLFLFLLLIMLCLFGVVVSTMSIQLFFINMFLFSVYDFIDLHNCIDH